MGHAAPITVERRASTIQEDVASQVGSSAAEQMSPILTSRAFETLEPVPAHEERLQARLIPATLADVVSKLEDLRQAGMAGSSDVATS